MRISKIGILIICFSMFSLLALKGQNGNTNSTSSASFLVANEIPDRTVFYSVVDSGEYKPITWGLDLAWLSRDNVRRGIAFMGKERVDVIRSSFTPTAPLVNGELQTEELSRLNERLNIIDLCAPETKVVLNSDHPRVDSWFKGNAEHWMQLIEVTARHHEEHGRTVVTVSPFNEPDYSATGQGTITDFYNIASLMKQNPYFNNIRVSGGNTLNTDQAIPWYNQLKSKLDEGNTHQLAGSFDNYAEFFETVRANGDHATNDELHNVMEAIVGVEYGLQTGIWWGTAEYARGEFVKASDGRRLGYAEHRPNWTAASVYRNPDGQVQAFGGTSERQAATSTYRFVSTDRDVFYNGHGPQREYIMELPGGTGYQQGQTNAENVVNITWGEDIQPVIDGRYKLVNRNSGKVIEVANGSSDRGINIQQNTSTGASYQKWKVTPVDSRIGGDFSYFSITALHSGKAMDIYNWSIDSGAEIKVWDNTKGGNQQFYLEYAGDGWFYIRSRHSALCLDVLNNSLDIGAIIVQEEKNDNYSQQWRFIPGNAEVEFDVPQAPQDLSAISNAASIQLNWTANSESDFSGYTILRSDSAGGPYSLIARDVITNSFVDNTAISGKQYFYVVKATDKALNGSEYSNEVQAGCTGEKTILAHYSFDGHLLDSTINLNHCAAYEKVSFETINGDNQALNLDGKQNFLQLPVNIANHREITVSSWVYWYIGAASQRIFDFGIDEQHCIYLTPQMHFEIKNAEVEYRIESAALPRRQWIHVAVTLDSMNARIYINGKLTEEIELSNFSLPAMNPIFNYIGRGQEKAQLFNGKLDDFRVYNYSLTKDEIADLASPIERVGYTEFSSSTQLSAWPVPATHLLHVKINTRFPNESCLLTLFTSSGQRVLSQTINGTVTNQIPTSQLSSGVYLLEVITRNETIRKQIIIQND